MLSITEVGQHVSGAARGAEGPNTPTRKRKRDKEKKSKGVRMGGGATSNAKIDIAAI